jgi:hypothetical protein
VGCICPKDSYVPLLELKNKELWSSKFERLNADMEKLGKNKCDLSSQRPPLWSSGQSSWLQIRRPGFDSRRYQIFLKKNKKKTVVGLERGALSLVSTTEELLDRKVAAPV